jgi:hypothetical protein
MPRRMVCLVGEDNPNNVAYSKKGVAMIATVTMSTLAAPALAASTATLIQKR